MCVQQARRKPVGLVMSDQQRSTIEGALSALRGDAAAAPAQQPSSTEPAAGTDALPAGVDDPAAVEALTTRLCKLGFDGGDVQRALAQHGAEPLSVSAALDWLCLHVPHERLPKGFAAGVLSFTYRSLCCCKKTCTMYVASWAPCVI